jgi:hypothetical protein
MKEQNNHAPEKLGIIAGGLVALGIAVLLHVPPVALCVAAMMFLGILVPLTFLYLDGSY